MKNLRIGGVDINGYIKEQVAIAIAEQLKQPEQFKQPEQKWYDNIPEQGVLCWCKEHENDIKYKRLIERIDEHIDGMFLSRTTGFLYKTVQPLTNEEIEEFKR